MKKSNKDDAVSPVIGVMLMLVVTIIIAALVSSFAGGVVTSQERVPVATLDVTLSAADVPAGNQDYYVQIKNLGGETLKLGELRISTTYTVPDKYNGKPVTHAGKVIRHTIDGSLDAVSSNYLDTSVDNYPFVPQTNTLRMSTRSNPDEFTLNDLNAGFTFGKKATAYFADYLLSTGNILKVSKESFLGFPIDERNLYGFAEGSVVHVTISHIPSNKIIFDQDVVATW